MTQKCSWYTQGLGVLGNACKGNPFMRLDLSSCWTLGVCKLVWARRSGRYKQTETAIGRKDHRLQAHTAWVQILAVRLYHQRCGLPLRLVE